MNTGTESAAPSTTRVLRVALQAGFCFFLLKGCVWLLVAALLVERL